MSRYRGLTWDHPRGYRALRAAAAPGSGAPPCDIEWDVQPLEGFESASLAQTAASYDVLVIDHPHVGDAVEQGVLRPWESLLDRAELDRLDAASMGPSLASYELAGSVWALPFDAATQVSVRRHAGVPEPTGWEEAVALADEVPVVLPTAGPHPFLTLCAIAVANGVEPATGPGFLPEEAVAEALAVIRHFVSGPRGHTGGNPIDVLARMQADEGPLYCPHVYGYVNYAAADAGPGPLIFGEAPVGRAGRHGAVLGGTGLALSASCRPGVDLVEHLRWLMDDTVQSGFIPAHGGQPSAAAAWRDPDLDRRYGGFYSRTRTTLEDSWIRPRVAGAVRFQQRAAEAVREALAGSDDGTRLTHDLDTAWLALVADPATRSGSSAGTPAAQPRRDL